MTAAPGRPVSVRLWQELNHLMRLHGDFTRAAGPADRTAAARAMAERAERVPALAADLLAEAEAVAAGPTGAV